jgi:hypothetical protein
LGLILPIAANTAARNSLITTPVDGQMVLVVNGANLELHTYYNSAWITVTLG